MLSYTSRRALFGNLVNNSDSTILSIADTLLNDRTRFVLTRKPWWFLEKPFTLTSLASQQFIPLPGQIDRIISNPILQVGSFTRMPRECPSRDYWNYLNSNTSVSSDFPRWWYQYNGQLGFYPKLATAGNIITFNAKPRIVDLKNADYTAGKITDTSNVARTFTVTIASPGVFTLTAHGFKVNDMVTFTTTGALPTGLSTSTTYWVIAAGLTANAFEVSTSSGGSAVNTSGSQSGTHSVGTITTTVTGDGSVVWSSAFAGWWIRIDSSATLTNWGDDVWYEVATVPTSSTLILKSAYGGTAITSSTTATYTLGQMTLLPEAYDSLPLYLALETYYTSIEPEPTKAGLYGAMAKDLFTQMNQEQSNRTGGRVIDWGMDEPTPLNPNITIYGT